MPDATNSKVREATQISNASEFIESSAIENAFDEQAGSILNEIKKNEAYLKAQLGEEKFKEVKEILEKIHKEEEAKGEFVTQEGDIDRRTPDKKDIKLPHGFEIQCGIKGSKLSGG